MPVNIGNTFYMKSLFFFIIDKWQEKKALSALYKTDSLIEFNYTGGGLFDEYDS